MLNAQAIPPSELDALVQALGLLDPTDSGPRRRAAAPRLSSLAGKRVGLLDNRKPNAALLLEALGGMLRERHAVAVTALCSKFIYSRPAAAGLIEELSGYDAVVTAIGD